MKSYTIDEAKQKSRVVMGFGCFCRNILLYMKKELLAKYLYVWYSNPLWKSTNGTTFTMNTMPASGWKDNDWHPSGNYALIVGTQGKVDKYDYSPEKHTQTSLQFDSVKPEFNCVKWNPCGDTALLVGGNGAVFKTNNGTCFTRLQNPLIPSNATLFSVSWKNNGEALIVGAGIALRYNKQYDSFEAIDP